MEARAVPGGELCSQYSKPQLSVFWPCNPTDLIESDLPGSQGSCKALRSQFTKVSPGWEESPTWKADRPWLRLQVPV